MNPNQNAPSLGSSLIWVHTVCLSIKETAVLNVRKRLQNLSLVLKVGRKSILRNNIHFRTLVQ